MNDDPYSKEPVIGEGGDGVLSADCRHGDHDCCPGWSGMGRLCKCGCHREPPQDR